MADYRSKYSGLQIDEAVGRSFDIDMGLNGWVKLASSKEDPYNLDYLISVGNYTIFFFEGGTEEMNAISPIKISVMYLNDTLTQIVTIMDKVQSRQYIDDQWSAWESWYSTGYIYQQSIKPSTPMRDALWIDTSDVTKPVFYVFDGARWREVRPTDAMDKSIYDPQNKATDVFAYIDKMIHDLNTMPDGENTYADAYAVHIADNTIHLTSAEKKDLMRRPSAVELEEKISDINSTMKQDITKTADDTLHKVDSAIGKIEDDTVDMMAHIENTAVHVTPEQTASWDAKADRDHTHFLDGRIKIDASALVSGIIPIERIPKIVMEVVVKVANEEEMYALKQVDVQNGDSVYVIDTKRFYYVIDDTQLDKPEGYLFYATVISASIPWSNIVDKPTTRDGFNLLDVYTMSEVDQLIYESDSQATNYLTNIFARSKQLYDTRWYDRITESASPVDHSRTRVVADDGYVYYVSKVSENDTEKYYLMKIAPYESTSDYTDVDLRTDPVTAKESEVVCELPELNIETVYINTVNPLQAMLDYYRDEYLSVDYAIEEGSYIDTEYNFLYSTTLNKLFGIVDGVFKEVHYDDIKFILYTKTGTTSTFYGVLSDNTIVPYVTITDDVEWDGDYIGYSVGRVYTGAFVTHTQNELRLYPANTEYATGIKTIAFKSDTDLIADIEVKENHVYVYLLRALDTKSLVDASWKAYKFSQTVADINMDTLRPVYYRVNIMNEIHEVGSSLDTDYQESLKSYYKAHLYSNSPIEKSYRLIISNSAFILYSTEKAFVSVDCVSWSNLYQQWIDISTGIVDSVNMTGNMIRFSSSYGNDIIFATRINSNGNREWAYSVDNYNFYRINLNKTWTTNLYKTSIASNVNGIYLLSSISDGESYHFEIIQLKLTSSSNVINDAIEKIKKIVDEDAGIPTSKTEYYEFSEFLRSPVDITNGEAGYYSLFVDASLPNPTSWYHIHYTNGDITETIPAIDNLPSDVSTFYIKGGFLYHSTKYLIVHMVHDDGSVSIGVAVVSSSASTLVSPTFVKVLYLTADDVKNINYQFHKKNDVLYCYPNYTHEYTGALKMNIPVITINILTAEVNVIIKENPGTYHTEIGIPDIQWMGVLCDRPFLYRARRNRDTETSINVEYMYWDRNDYALTSTPEINTFSIDMGCTNLNTPYPIVPFELSEKIMLAFPSLIGGNLIGFFVLNPNDASFELYSTHILMEGDKPYTVVYDKSTQTLFAIMVGGTTDNIITYRIEDEDEITSDSFVRVGEVTKETLNAMSYNKGWVFDGVLPFYVNHTFMIMNTSPNLDRDDSRVSIFEGTPIISFLRDNGVEIYKKSFAMASRYTDKLSEYEKKYDALVQKILVVKDYTDEILRILG